jgi:hypothetical protein
MKRQGRPKFTAGLLLAMHMNHQITKKQQKICPAATPAPAAVKQVSQQELLLCFLGAHKAGYMHRANKTAESSLAPQIAYSTTIHRSMHKCQNMCCCTANHSA